MILYLPSSSVNGLTCTRALGDVVLTPMMIYCLLRMSARLESRMMRSNIDLVCEFRSVFDLYSTVIHVMH